MVKVTADDYLFYSIKKKVTFRVNSWMEFENNSCYEEKTIKI